MIPIEGLFEAHIMVRDLPLSVAFYRDVIGLELGIGQLERPAAFLWVGGRGKSMMGLFASGSYPSPVMQHHLSFQVKVQDLLAAPQRLRSSGLTPRGRRTAAHPRGEPVDEPIVHAWMPAASITFDDPDGNLLEYVAMLPDPPRPDAGIVSWSEWNNGRISGATGSGNGLATPVERLFGDHISVRNLERSLRFYGEVLGMEPGVLQPRSEDGMGGALLWAGGRGRSMLGLFSLGSTWPLIILQHHVAFQVSRKDVLRAPHALRTAGVIPMGAGREPVDEPVVFTWMPAASIFFEDPDGNLLEYIAMLDEPARPELGLLLPWSEWQSRKARQS